MMKIQKQFAALTGDDQNLDYLDGDYDSTKDEKPEQTPAPAHD
jgi:hypothetical protein